MSAMPRGVERFRFLNSKERKEILGRIKESWGAEPGDELVFLMNSQNRIFVVSRDVEKIDLSQIRVNNMGLYFGEITERDELRLSIEGSSIVGRAAKTNIVELDDGQSRRWFAGEDIEIEDERNGFMIVKFKADFLGCGKLARGKLYNFVPKARRIEAMI